MSNRSTLDLSRIAEEDHLAATQYDGFLAKLTFNSKPIITELTVIASKNVPAYNAICTVIEQRIAQAQGQLKLPLFYLLDSIVKNVNGPFATRIKQNLFNTYTRAYKDMPVQDKVKMKRMMQTWPDYFGQNMVDLIAKKTKDLDSNFEVPISRKGSDSNKLNSQNNQGLKTAADGSGKIPDLKDEKHNSGLPSRQGKNKRPFHKNHHQKWKDILQSNSNLSSSDFSVGNNSGLGFLIPGPTPIQIHNQFMYPSYFPLATIQCPVSTPVQPQMSESVQLLQNQTQKLTSMISDRAIQGFPPSKEQILELNRLIDLQLGHTTDESTVQNLLAIKQQLLPHFFDGDSRESQNTREAITSQYVKLTFENVKFMPPQEAVKSLYENLIYSSKADGMRFACVFELRVHMDWIFARNKSKKARQQGGFSRGWYPTNAAWLSGSEENVDAPKFDFLSKMDNPEDLEKTEFVETMQPITENLKPEAKTTEKHVIPIGDDDEVCEICGGGFESFWDEETENWMYKNACHKGVSDGQLSVVHFSCIQMSTPRLALTGKRKIQDNLKESQEPGQQGAPFENLELL